MVNKYRFVYLKPDKGALGNGIIRVDKIREKGRNRFKYQYGEQQRYFPSFEAMLPFINRLTVNKDYIIQRGIQLLRYRNRPLDIRVMVQQNPRGGWEVTGMMGRVAHPKKVVCNGAQGSTSLPVNILISPHIPKERIPYYRQMLRDLGTRVAHQLNRTYPGLKEIGIDVGIDNELNLWIFEANTRPSFKIFQILKDKTVFQRMCRFAKAYGRI